MIFIIKFEGWQPSTYAYFCWTNGIQEVLPIIEEGVGLCNENPN